MKKNKGFTLIELLVVIALMLSLLGIAIISFVNVSNKKKEQAYKLVKEQAVTAGEEFFDTNLYIFDGLSANDTSGIITIGKLVNEDYLNVLTDPRTGKKINKCDYVEVTRTNSGYKTKYVESNSTNCQDTENTIVVQEAGAPSIEVEIIGTYNDFSKWYYKTKPSVYAVVKTNNNGPIMKVEKCLSSSCSDETFKNASSFETRKTQLDDGRNIKIMYTATNSSGKSAVAITTIDVDTVKPDCTSNISNNKASTGWYNNSTGAPKITFKGTDALSDIDGKKSITPTIKPGKNVSYSQKFKDKAGNEGSCSIEVSYDNTNPKCTINANGTKTNGWYRGIVTLSLNGTDTLSGIDNSSYTLNGSGGKTTTLDKNTNEKNKIVYGSVNDMAGNSNSCNITLNVENKLPECGTNNGKSKWTNDSKLEITQNYTSLSGNGSIKQTFTFDNGKVQKVGNIKIKSPAGNENNCSVNLYIDRKPPTFDLSSITVTQYKDGSSFTKSKTFYSSGGTLLLENFSGSYGPSKTEVKNLKDCNNDGVDCSGVDKNSQNTVFVAERTDSTINYCLDHDSNKKCHYNTPGYAPCDSALKYCVKDIAGNEACKWWNVDARYYKDKSQGDYPGRCTNY